MDVTSTKNISIDLNGNTLLSKGETQAIKNTGDLSIKDTSENETGLIQVTSTSEAYGIKHESAKKLEINGGNVCATSSNTSSENVYGVYVNSNGATLIINGGKLKGIRNGTYIPAGMAINNSGDIQSGKVNLPEGKHLTYTIEGKYVVNYLADGEIVATLEQNGVTTNYVSIQDAVAAIVANGTLAKITMYQSESLGRTIEILEGQNIELDLNGKEIYYSASHNTIKNSGNLIINDSSDGSGKITNENKFFLYGRVINNVGKGKITINSGCIYSNNMNSSCDVNAIQNSSTGTIEINGGTITGNDGKIICNASTGTIQLNSGEILSNSGAMGISNDASGYVEMNGGSISTTTQFVINNSGTGKVNIYGGDFYSSYWDARAINNNSTGEINIYGGNINTSGSNVSCIYNNGSGKVAIYGGNISASGGQSKGIYNNSKGKIIIGTDDGTIKNEPVISGTYAIYQRVLGSEVYFYDGILKGTDTNVVYPAETKFK